MLGLTFRPVPLRRPKSALVLRLHPRLPLPLFLALSCPDSLSRIPSFSLFVLAFSFSFLVFRASLANREYRTRKSGSLPMFLIHPDELEINGNPDQ